MHVPPSDRSRAFRKLITLLKPGGFLAITLRDGPSEGGRSGSDVYCVWTGKKLGEQGLDIDHCLLVGVAL